jgi:hypothetical protein
MTGQFCAEAVMADEDQRKIYIVKETGAIPQTPGSSAQPTTRTAVRTDEELRPLAQRIVENPELILQFRAAIGSNDEDQTAKAMHKVREYAQSLDPSVTFREGTRLVLLLLKMLGYSGDGSNERR